MDQVTLDAILYRHHKWLRGMAGGVRADLTDANLTRADLTDADLTDAKLTRADLTDAKLTRANLTDADLTDAKLTRANLTDADLTDAKLTRANLTDADLTDAKLTRANLTDADLTDAKLTRADLTRADLTRAKEDVIKILDAAKPEVPGLLAALRDGRIEGSCYTGSCACLVGTIANIRGVAYQELEGIIPNGSRPAERWFLAIREDDTPHNSVIAKITEEWIVEWLEAQQVVEGGNV